MVYYAGATTGATAMVTPVVPMVPTAMAAAAIVHNTGATAVVNAGTTTTPVATVTGDGLTVTAQQGDADNREENRDAQKQCSIHPRILQTSNLA